MKDTPLSPEHPSSTGRSFAASAPLILASASPRRRDLLAQAGVAFEVITSPLPEPERKPSGVNFRAWAMALAYFKAAAVAQVQLGRWVLGADTIVVVGGRVLNKAATVDEAREMLLLQMGRESSVLTGVATIRIDFSPANSCGDEAALMRPRSQWTMLETPCAALPIERHFRCAVTQIWMKNDRPAMERYLATGDWQGKAGAYGIQNVGDELVERIDGSFSNVVGLPVETLKGLRKVWGM